jgi:hypothetical protein
MTNLIFYDKKWIDWTIRIVFAYDIIMPGLNFPSVVYPLNVLITILIAFILYTFRLKTFCLLFLLVAAFFNFFHFNDYHCC